MNARKFGRKGHLQVIADAVGKEALPFPGKIVVMADGGDVRLRDYLREGQPKRDVHRDGQGIFHDQELNIEFFDELIQVLL